MLGTMHQQDATHPTGVRAVTGRENEKELIKARYRKARAAVQLRKMGADWEEVAQTLGYPTGRAALVATEKALEHELKTPESREFMRNLAVERLDTLLRQVMPKALDPDSPDQMVAQQRAREHIMSQAKILGLEAPTEMVVHSPTLNELEAWVAQAMATRTDGHELEEPDIFEIEVVEDAEATR